MFLKAKHNQTKINPPPQDILHPQCICSKNPGIQHPHQREVVFSRRWAYIFQASDYRLELMEWLIAVDYPRGISWMRSIGVCMIIIRICIG